MYRFIALLTALVALMTALFDLFFPLSEEKTYAITTQVIQVDYDNNLVVCEDFNGNLWEFEGTEDWMYGDIATLTMNDKGTETIYDDEIVSTVYNGYFNGFPKG